MPSVYFYSEPSLIGKILQTIQHNDWGFITYPYNFSNWKYISVGSFLGGSLVSALILGRMMSPELSPLESTIGPVILSLGVGSLCSALTVRPRVAFAVIGVQIFVELGRCTKTL